jgi:hypothetical protein
MAKKKNYSAEYLRAVRAMPLIDKTELSQRQSKALIKSFSVACYCSLDGPGQDNPFVNGQRWWQLLMCKQFANSKAMGMSRSLNKLYAPFDFPSHLVVSFARGQRLPQYLCEYDIGYPAE